MKIRMLALSTVAGMFFMGALAARANTPLAQADVPFAFVVGNEVLPAGHYAISKVDSPVMLILVRSTDGKQAAFSTVLAADPKLSNNEITEFVFKRYGDTYFLEDICLGPSQTALELPKTKHERELMAAGVAETTIEVAELAR